MPRYELAPAEVGQIVERMTERYHPELRDAGVTIECLMAFPTVDKNGDSSGAALKHGGYPVAATVRAIGLKDRTAGRADVEIVIDGDRWPTWSEEQCYALIDHELEHLELKTDKDGALVRDDLDRPRFKMRKHDWQFGWFDSIVRRHGRHAFEHTQLVEFQEVGYQQRWLPFLDEPDTTPKTTATMEHAMAAAEPSHPKDFRDEVEKEFESRGILAGKKSSKRKHREPAMA